MDWHLYITFFGLSTIKFLFTPFGGPAAGLSFIETYVSCVSGGLFSAVIFYFSSEFFMIRAHKKRVELLRISIETGVPLKPKKKFTRMNKFIVLIKRRLGIVGVAMYAPLFLSVPIGSIIAAKFYGKEKRTFPLIAVGMFVNGAITTGIAFLVDMLF
ncbi:MAG TPA: hypothetical protein VK151_11765 [Fluviicola sp.]|nr:hypothetical protein [Fluviicola sp.]